MKKKKLPSLARLKRKLDLVFSIWIRKRDADDDGMGRCVSCGDWALLQAGHFIPRQYVAIRWDERNCHGQCSRCNCWLHGNLIEYYAFMMKNYGLPVIDELRQRQSTTVKMTRSDYETLLNRFK